MKKVFIADKYEFERLRHSSWIRKDFADSLNKCLSYEKASHTLNDISFLSRNVLMTLRPIRRFHSTYEYKPVEMYADVICQGLFVDFGMEFDSTTFKYKQKFTTQNESNRKHIGKIEFFTNEIDTFVQLSFTGEFSFLDPILFERISLSEDFWSIREYINSKLFYGSYEVGLSADSVVLGEKNIFSAIDKVLNDEVDDYYFFISELQEDAIVFSSKKKKQYPFYWKRTDKILILSAFSHNDTIKSYPNDLGSFIIKDTTLHLTRLSL